MSGNIVTFGPFRLRRHERSITGPNGEIVLSNRAFDILSVLLERADRVVSKSELLDLVWPGVVVEENNLQVHISAIRKALGKEIVTTVPGRGYKYVGAPPSVARSQADALDKSTALTEPLLEHTKSSRPKLGRLPAFPTSLIGREDALRELRECISKSWLTTIVGPGGVGKTRLAITAAKDLESEFADGAYLVDFSAIDDSQFVAAAVAKAVGVTLTQGEPPIETLRSELEQGHRLLILDNCEHVIEGVASFAAAMLPSTIKTRLLATSREPIGLSGEKVYRLQPLPIPSALETDPIQIAASDAVRLFLDRAGLEARQFAGDPNSLAMVGEICRQLDGMPLGLEMAAAHASTLGIDNLNDVLRTKFRLQMAGERVATSRHKSLGTVLDWSVDLLDEADRKLFWRLAVFPANFDLTAAFALASEPGDQEWQFAERLNSLVRKSLVATDSGTVRRFRLLEAVKAYAREMSDASQDERELHHRHALLTLNRLRESHESWPGMADSLWLTKFAGDIDDLRTALSWSESANERALYSDLAAAGYRLWLQIGNPAEGLRYAQNAAKSAARDTNDRASMELKLAVAELAAASAMHVLAQASASSAIPICRKENDARGLVTALARVGFSLTCHRQHEDAEMHLQEAFSLMDAIDDPKLRASVTVTLGMNRCMMGAKEEGYRLCRLGLEWHLANDEQLGYRRSLLHFAECAFWCGDNNVAIENARLLVQLLRGDRMPRLLGYALCNLATYLLTAGEIAEARACLLECSHTMLRVTGTWRWSTIQNHAFLSALEGEYERAAKLLGYSDHGFEMEEDERQATEETARQTLMEILSGALEHSLLSRLMAEGAAWDERIARRHLIDPRE